MFTAIAAFVSGLFSPATSLLKEIHAPEEEKMKIQLELSKLAAATHDKLIESEKLKMELESKVLESANKIATAEITSSSWFTRSYRPAIITGMFLLICASAFGLTKYPIPEIFWTIFGASFGVSQIGRSIEKIKGAAN